TNHEQYGLGWHVWLRKSLNEDKPWDVMVNEMLSAEGHSAKNPASGYYLRDRNMLLDNVSNTVQVFLGHQIGCAQCHDHPFDKWTQMEYYELAAFSGGLSWRSQESRDAVNSVVNHMKASHPGMNAAAKDRSSPKARQRARQKQTAVLARKASGSLRNLFRDFSKNEISEFPKGVVKLPDDYQYEDGDPGEVIPPATLFGPKIGDVAPEERRRAFADWVTSPENPYFTKVIANRLWDRTFGHGLVDPLDDWSGNAKTAHPKVLEYLEFAMKAVKYRTRDFDRILFHSRLFQREVSPKEATPGTEYAFVGPQLRRLKAEELYDSLTVLAFGNTDDNINTTLEEKWNEHRKKILNILDYSPKELIAAGELATKAEKERRDFQDKSRNLRFAIQKASKAGNSKEVAKLRREETALRSAYRDRRETMMSSVPDRYTGRNAKARINMRASEHPTPFRGDHLVRQFGGSDRNIPESAHTSASVPQALTLLNGQIANSAENRKSKVFEALSEITSAESRLDYLFLAFFASKPTEAEKEQFLPLASNREDIFTLARAMLTSNRFLFVQ
ncbi:MAG: DUF1553 domain-containing protein, partial [Akkermansiaceae bacterium]|nr:DUF1553 domain-containing protein [Akkermansiaceae bacterium]